MKKTFFPLLFSLLLTLLPSCLKDDTVDYSEWRQKNDDYINSLDLNEYTKYVPDWAPAHSVYMKWHNDRSLTQGNLVPISTSTVRCTYRLENIEGTLIDTSYKTNGDSIYEAKVNANVIGFWAALTNMHVGDSVTMVIPYSSGYGASASGSLLPYSDLVYRVKLVEIPAYERPLN